MRDGHEVLTRRRGGSTDDPDNVLGVCRACHDWIHRNVRQAELLGLLQPSEDAMNAIDDIETTAPTSLAASAKRAARRERLRGEYEQAVATAARYGMELIGHSRVQEYGCYYLTVCEDVELQVMAATGKVDASELPSSLSTALAESMRVPTGIARVESLVAFVENVIVVCGLAPAPAIPQYDRPPMPLAG